MIHLLAFLVAQAPSIPPDVAADTALLGKMAAHAAVIAGFIRFAVRVLRSPIVAFVWLKVPVQVRPLVIAALSVLAAVFDHLALGESIAQSIFAAAGGFMGAISTHEIQQRVMPKTPEVPGV